MQWQPVVERFAKVRVHNLPCKARFILLSVGILVLGGTTSLMVQAEPTVASDTIGRKSVRDLHVERDVRPDEPSENARRRASVDLVVEKRLPAQRRNEQLRMGAALFEQRCVRCHGAAGRGTELREDYPSIPDFTDSAWHASRTEPQLRASILNGRGLTMPAFGDELSGEQVSSLVAFLRSYSPGNRPLPKQTLSDFDKRYEQLRNEWMAVEKQLQDLKPPND